MFLQLFQTQMPSGWMAGTCSRLHFVYNNIVYAFNTSRGRHSLALCIVMARPVNKPNKKLYPPSNFVYSLLPLGASRSSTKFPSSKMTQVLGMSFSSSNLQRLSDHHIAKPFDRPTHEGADAILLWRTSKRCKLPWYLHSCV